MMRNSPPRNTIHPPLLTRTPDGAARIPWIAHHAVTGDWDQLAFAMDEVGTGGVATRLLMFWSIVCNEPWARWSPARTHGAGRGTYLAERVALDSARRAVCSAMPKTAQPAWSKARVRSDVPVLLVVGGNDPQDPVANVRDAVRELPSSRTIVVPNAGHGSLQLGCTGRSRSSSSSAGPRRAWTPAAPRATRRRRSS